ncbi:MAG: exodeoxyribonuclease III [Sandaracinaceae bacterium]|nr:exodeoxyribonuclease III [Sandaracinaceae bacterium]
MRIATWNVNSIRARHDRLLAFLTRHRPDVLCLQELKVEDSGFPHVEVRAAGYHAAILGQRTYNGVAILSREPLADVRAGMGDDVEDPQARLISGVIRGLRVISAYFPNGGELGSDKYRYKLAWMKRLRAMLARDFSPSMPLVLAGDFNVAPDERDTKNPAVWKDTVLFSDEVREALRELRSWGLLDSLRLVNDQPGLFSWWDYRMLGFPKNDGLRIDHLDVTEPLRARVRDVRIDRDERKGKQPSDHAPVILELAD